MPDLILIGTRKVLAIGAAILVAGLLALIHFGKSESGVPALLTILGVEPAGVFEDSGEELQLVTLGLSERRHLPQRPQKRVFVRDAGRPLEAKVADRWVSVEAKLWNRCELWPDLQYERLVVVPARTTACRLRLQYSRAILSEERSVWLRRRLPTWIPFHQQVWDWLGNSAYRPGGSWREMQIEVPLPGMVNATDGPG